MYNSAKSILVVAMLAAAGFIGFSAHNYVSDVKPVVTTPKDQNTEVEKDVEVITDVPINAIGNFKAIDHFKVDTSGPVRIAWIGKNFSKFLLNNEEPAVGDTNLKEHGFLNSNHENFIFCPFGCKITLGQLFELLSKQGQGQSGPLFVNGTRNIISDIYDMKGDSWTVEVEWYKLGGGWTLNTRPSGHVHTWLQ